MAWACYERGAPCTLSPHTQEFTCDSQLFVWPPGFPSGPMGWKGTTGRSLPVCCKLMAEISGHFFLDRNIRPPEETWVTNYFNFFSAFCCEKTVCENVIGKRIIHLVSNCVEKKEWGEHKFFEKLGNFEALFHQKCPVVKICIAPLDLSDRNFGKLATASYTHIYFKVELGPK
jgi:hypothetical protein